MTHRQAVTPSGLQSRLVPFLLPVRVSIGKDGVQQVDACRVVQRRGARQDRARLHSVVEDEERGWAGLGWRPGDEAGEATPATGLHREGQWCAMMGWDASGRDGRDGRATESGLAGYLVGLGLEMASQPCRDRCLKRRVLVGSGGVADNVVGTCGH